MNGELWNPNKKTALPVTFTKAYQPATTALVNNEHLKVLSDWSEMVSGKWEWPKTTCYKKPFCFCFL